MVYIIFLLPAPASRLHSVLPSSHRTASSSSDGREVVALSPDGSVVMASCMAATIS
ncbi:MAG: hypothetical protein V8T40_15105 [Phocaeicola vulgatus]